VARLRDKGNRVSSFKKGGVMKRYVSRGLCFFTILVLVFTFSSSVYAAEKVIKLKYYNFFPPPHKNSVLIDEWCKEVEKRTDGRVKVTHFPGGTLGPPDQAYEAVVKGIFDIGTSVEQYTSGRFPLTEVLDLPLGVKSGYQATMLSNAFYKKFKPKEYDDTKVFYLYAHGPGLFHTKKQISKLEDLKGLKLKCSPNNASIVSAFGAVPVTMPLPDTYEALQRGLVDGILLPSEALKGWKFADFIRCTLENHGMAYSSALFVIMNKDKWNSLPPDIQKIIEKINEEWMEKQGHMWDEIDRDGLNFGLEKGLKVVKATPEDEAKAAAIVKPILDNYIKRMKAKGWPGDQVVQFCTDYVKTHR
jgi:TRAP-type C4-dicarboxylate transport system substrate-binding protein